jgi:hypothetical protein
MVILIGRRTTDSTRLTVRLTVYRDYRQYTDSMRMCARCVGAHAPAPHTRGVRAACRTVGNLNVFHRHTRAHALRPYGLRTTPRSRDTSTTDKSIDTC